MNNDPTNITCPTPKPNQELIQLAHGGGGKMMKQLIERLFIANFSNALLDKRHDGAVLEINGAKLAFTTDSYVVHPLFFPGGDIGTLAINGTVNDLAMCGAKPLYLSVGVILEEGFPIADLEKIVESMRKTAKAAGVSLVTGDTKVVDKGKGDGIFINTAGVGVIEHDVDVSPQNVKAGDAIILSGDIGRHGTAIMAVRENLSFETSIESDCAPVAAMVKRLLDERVDVHCMRDLTRGGLASSLVEIAEVSKLQIKIKETFIPVREDVHGACEILGLDPLYVANEGRFIAFVSDSNKEKALEIMGPEARLIGQATSGNKGLVTM